MDLETRAVETAGIVAEPYEQWVMNMVRGLLDQIEGFLLGKRYLILDRDPVFTKRVRQMLGRAGVKVVRLPARSPNWFCTAGVFGEEIEDRQATGTFDTSSRNTSRTIIPRGRTTARGFQLMLNKLGIKAEDYLGGACSRRPRCRGTRSTVALEKLHHRPSVEKMVLCLTTCLRKKCARMASSDIE